MTLIKSISGIRGTIGGKVGEGLSPIDIVKFTAGFGDLCKQKSNGKKVKILVGRDARISGEMLNHLVVGTLIGLGIDVINIGLAATPTTEMAVIQEKANGGIILTASHNPKNWNALKLLNSSGEFISAQEGRELLELAEKADFQFAKVEDLGTESIKNDYDDRHIDKIMALNLVDCEAIKKAKFKVAVDGINSVGGIIVPKLLKKLGVDEIFELNCQANGDFAHVAEPLPEHLTEISKMTKQKNADVGFVVDPDVDRLAIICEDGTMFGEEYTLVAVADYILSKTAGNTVSNLSSSRALRDITHKYNGTYAAAAVGEVNVTKKMKETNAVIGGEGNGGVIYPENHYGRDAIVGIALFLSHLAQSGIKCSQVRKKYPTYFISKNKIRLTPETNIDNLLEKIKEHFENQDVEISTIDGVKIDFAEEWVHLRKSNTEPIIRIYAESKSQEKAEKLANEIIGITKKWF